MPAFHRTKLNDDQEDDIWRVSQIVKRPSDCMEGTAPCADENGIEVETRPSSEGIEGEKGKLEAEDEGDRGGGSEDGEVHGSSDQLFNCSLEKHRRSLPKY